MIVRGLSFGYGPEKAYILIGCQFDGKFVKYIDTTKITKRYYIWDRSGASPIFYKRITVRGDAITISYMAHRSNINLGEFRFKWDNKAQWFSVEQAVY